VSRRLVIEIGAMRHHHLAMGGAFILASWLGLFGAEPTGTDDTGGGATTAVPSPAHPEPDDRVLRIGGFSLLGGAALAFAPSLAFKGILTRSDAEVARRLADGSGDCERDGWCYAGGFVNPMTGLGFTFAAALGGGGMHLLGRARAQRDLASGTQWAGARVSTGVGILLVVGGVVSLGATQLAALRADEELPSFRVRESGWYLFGLMVPAGALALGYGHGYQRHMRRSPTTARLWVTPILGPTQGASIAGRF
jgi:hypothetical protein